jgi:hypothetical protein
LFSKDRIIGISLKKKERSAQVDPTLINTPIHSYLSHILSKKDMDALMASRVKFFSNAIQHPDFLQMQNVSQVQ